MLITLLSRLLQNNLRLAGVYTGGAWSKTGRTNERLLLHCTSTRRTSGKYTLATGEAAAYRLGLLQRVYGPGTKRALMEAGLKRGMHVADLGCGIGTVTANAFRACWAGGFGRGRRLQ